MDLNTIWFVLLAVLLAGYAILDGFDLGVGIWHLFSRDEKTRRIHLDAIGPVWDGNEVWLLTGGGALFAAFPIAYATLFSGFYTALMLLLAALIARAVAIEFRHHISSTAWKRTWDWAFGLGSLIAALLLSVALGNILRGVPIDKTGAYTGTFWGLLNPYALIVGVMGLLLLAMHGAAYLAAKAEDELAGKMRARAAQTWAAFIVAYIVFAVATPFAAPHLVTGLTAKPAFWGFLMLQLLGIASVPVMAYTGRGLYTFLASTMIVAGMAGLIGISLFPRLAPSCLDLANSLTVYNAASTPRTHGVMLVVALLGMPLVIGYTAYVYWVFRDKATGETGY